MKIKDLEETVKRVNRENLEMKKDLKIVTEMRKFLQRRVNFLEEENRKLRRGGAERQEHITDLKILGTEMMEAFQSPSRTMEDVGDLLQIKHYNSNKESVLHSFEKTRSGERDEPEKRARESQRRIRKRARKLQISIPETEEVAEMEQDTGRNREADSRRGKRERNKRKMRVQIKKKPKKAINIMIPEDEPKKVKVRSTRVNKKFYFENEVPFQQSPMRRDVAEQSQARFEKKSYANEFPQKEPAKGAVIGKKGGKKRKRRKPKHFNQSNLKMPSSSNLEKHDKAKQTIYTSHKRLHKKNLAHGFLDSMKRDHKRKIRRGTEGTPFMSKQPSEAGAYAPKSRVPFSRAQAYATGSKEAIWVKQPNGPAIIKSVNNLDINSQKYIRRYIKKISIDPQHRRKQAEWGSHESSEKNSRPEHSPKLSFSNRNLVIERIKTEPISKAPGEFECPQHVPNSSFQINEEYKNSCSISVNDIRSEQKMTLSKKKSEILPRRKMKDLEIFSMTKPPLKKPPKAFKVSHLLPHEHLYKNLELARSQRQSDMMVARRIDELEGLGMGKPIKPHRVSENVFSHKKGRSNKFSKEFLNLEQEKIERRLPEVKTDLRANPLNLTGYIKKRSGVKKRDRLSVKSGMAGVFKVPNYTQGTALRVIGEKQKNAWMYSQNLIGKKPRKSKLAQAQQRSNKKFMSKERRKRGVKRDKPTRKAAKKKAHMPKATGPVQLASNKSNEPVYKQSVISISESFEDKLDREFSKQELRSLEMQLNAPANNTFENKQEQMGPDKRSQYYSCKSIAKDKIKFNRLELIPESTRTRKSSVCSTTKTKPRHSPASIQSSGCRSRTLQMISCRTSTLRTCLGGDSTRIRKSNFFNFKFIQEINFLVDC